jgi:hypothetical protein
MGLLCFTARRGLDTVRHGFLAFLLALLISLEIPEPSVVKAQEVPGLYADNQGRTGNFAWISRLTNPFASLFPEQQDPFPLGRPQGFSFMAEGLYMNLRTDAQVFAQNITTTTSTYLGSITGSSSASGNFQSIKPDKVRGLRVGLDYALEDWDARILYSRFRAEPESGQAGPSQINFVPITYLGFFIGGTATSVNPFAATAPFLALNNYQAEAGFNAHVFDFQAGYSIRLGQFGSSGLFGGISYVETHNTLEGTGAAAAGGFMSVNRSAVYRAWGPKIGLDLNCRLFGRGLNLRASGAVGRLFGTQQLTSNSDLGDFQDSNRQNITSVEGEAGIGYSFPSMEVTLGYRVERYSVNNLSFVDVGATLASGSLVRTGQINALQYLEGGFLRFELKL